MFAVCSLIRDGLTLNSTDSDFKLCQTKPGKLVRISLVWFLQLWGSVMLKSTIFVYALCLRVTNGART